jgi:hypothetical protein
MPASVAQLMGDNSPLPKKTAKEALEELSRAAADALAPARPSPSLFPPPRPDMRAIVREELRAALREQQERRQRNEDKQREASPPPAPIVRRSKEFASEPVFRAALLAACNRAWQKNRRTTELTVDDALIEMQITSDRGLCRRTLEHYYICHYRSWGGWLMIWHAEGPALPTKTAQ